MNIVLENDIKQDNYTNYICDKYDIQNREKVITVVPMINMEELEQFKWNIGIICGNSGSGKSTILNRIGKISEPIYDYKKPIVSQFPHLNEQSVCDLLCSVGLSSIPTWLHKPNELSNGEKARLDLAWSLVNTESPIILIDEYSSTIDRHYAKSMSFALQRFVRSKNIKIILATCHFDLMDFLRPDWVFNLNKQKEGNVEIEHLIYKDDTEFEAYKKVNNESILSETYSV